MLLVYALTLFISALLLFLVQPLIGKLIVPLLGGFPSVWNTCLVFFQAMLLAGYAYAHYSSNRLGERRQAGLHLVLVALIAVLVLLFRLEVFKGLVPAGDANPVPGLLLLLFAAAGLPFFAISATAPLLQRWFANTNQPAAKDPYFLYAASNVGSMLAVFSYLVLIEPYFTLVQQRWAWSIAFALLVLLLGACAVLFWNSPPPIRPQDKSPPPALTALRGSVATATPLQRFAGDFIGPSLATQSVAPGEGGITPGRALRWVALAFVPSSLMLGVTTYITTDVAAIPLLWVLPLALYLLSFILVFSKLPALVHRFMVLAMPVLLLLLIFMMVSRMSVQMWALILLHLVVLFAVAMVCHGELARDRPAPQHLTRFYLLLAVGGVLGGLFNALLAPVLFTFPVEYRVGLLLAALLLPRLDDAPGAAAGRTRRLDLLLPATLAFLCVEFFGTPNGKVFPVSQTFLHLFDWIAGQAPGDAAWLIVDAIGALAGKLSMKAENLGAILRYAPPLMLCYLFVERPLRFGLGVAVILLVSAGPAVFDPSVVYRDRSFFGVLNIRAGVEEGDQGLASHVLLHGNIKHGKQFDEPDLRRLPLTYYHRTGPIGQLMDAFQGDAARKDVAVIGLGTGTMAAYAESGQHYTFYEIDRAVKAISYDPNPYFSYVADARERGADVNIVLGDARLSLDRERETQPGQKYDLIVVDAFSSDAIPVHLMTRQALQIYRAKLKEGGIVAFHTSNRYLVLEPVVANIASAEGMACRMQDDVRSSAGPGKLSSTWVLVAATDADFGKLREDNRWQGMPADPRAPVWTDDFSNLVQVFRWSAED